MRKIKSKSNIGKKVFYWAMLVLPLLQFFIFYVCVNINSFVLAFQEFSIEDRGYKFIGFDRFFGNFAEVFKNLGEQSYLAHAFWNSFVVLFVGILVGCSLALLFSYYICKKKLFSKFFKIVLFLPSIVSAITLVIIFKYFVESAVPELVLKLFGAEIEGVLSNPDTEFAAILIFTLWTSFGIQVVIYSSSMSGVSESIIEAAKLDGITPMRELLQIYIPMIFPTISVFIVSSVAGVLVNQMNLFSFYGVNASNYDIWTIGYYIYRGVSVGTKSEYPYYAAFGLVMTFISIPITLIVQKLLNKFGPSED